MHAEEELIVSVSSRTCGNRRATLGRKRQRQGVLRGHGGGTDSLRICVFERGDPIKTGENFSDLGSMQLVVPAPRVRKADRLCLSDGRRQLDSEVL